MATVGDRNRLPTLFEVLSRRTLPPVDLFSFYIYMRDQQRSVDYLDFWYVACEEENFILPPLGERRRSSVYAQPRRWLGVLADMFVFLGSTSPSTSRSADTMSVNSAAVY